MHKPTLQNQLAIGAKTTVQDNADNSIAIGSDITSTTKNSIILGHGSDGSATFTKTESVTINNITYGNFAGTDDTDDEARVLSIGAERKERQIKHVAAGQIKQTSTDAINGSQLYAVMEKITESNTGQLKLLETQMNNRINKVDRNSRSGVAGAVAIASLSQAFNPGEGLVSLGGGTYRGASAVALGVSKVSNDGRWILKANGSADNSGHYSGGASIGFKF